MTSLPSLLPSQVLDPPPPGNQHLNNLSLGTNPELNNLISQVLGELSALHIFVRGGDVRKGSNSGPPNRATGRNKQGMGLGLFISKSIIEQHAGRLNVKSKPGKGTTFTVRLPSGKDSEGLPGPNNSADTGLRTGLEEVLAPDKSAALKTDTRQRTG